MTPCSRRIWRPAVRPSRLFETQVGDAAGLVVPQCDQVGSREPGGLLQLRQARSSRESGCGRRCRRAVGSAAAKQRCSFQRASPTASCAVLTAFDSRPRATARLRWGMARWPDVAPRRTSCSRARRLSSASSSFALLRGHRRSETSRLSRRIESANPASATCSSGRHDAEIALVSPLEGDIDADGQGTPPGSFVEPVPRRSRLSALPERTGFGRRRAVIRPASAIDRLARSDSSARLFCSASVTAPSTVMVCRAAWPLRA